MTLVYKQHLKRRTSMQVNWQKLFKDWISHENTIIELRSALQNLYSKEYVIGDREYRAWESLLRHVLVV